MPSEIAAAFLCVYGLRAACNPPLFRSGSLEHSHCNCERVWQGRTAAEVLMVLLTVLTVGGELSQVPYSVHRLTAPKSKGECNFLTLRQP